MFEDDDIRGRVEWMVQEVQNINEFTINLVVQVGRNGTLFVDYWYCCTPSTICADLYPLHRYCCMPHDS